ncbi:MAG: hypothetical protein GW921_03740, partial [Gallionella sp.]|nr:hypothetical protein [Gallionella sp.]
IFCENASGHALLSNGVAMLVLARLADGLSGGFGSELAAKLAVVNVLADVPGVAGGVR